MAKYLYTIITLILFSCAESTEKKTFFDKEETFEDLEEAKASFPGLGFNNDTTITIVHVFNPQTNVINKMFVYNENGDRKIFIDSILNTEKFKNDSVIFFQVECKPIPKLRSNFTVFIFGGFDGENVAIFQNNHKIQIENDTSKYFNYIKIDKSSIDSIGVSVNDSEPIYSIINKEYNYLRLFLVADSVVQFNYQYYWEEY